ncbi:hypothetical protein SAY87_013328 [Trapa incisa]|uniref:DUF4005 domain-containing protein n=1 Tax=Trapa incisa TaxID=236973 RepID=A0AAN7KAW3_9MYRT|nr:hypothetical protein SAY87_013328 [Trapa incisa]
MGRTPGKWLKTLLGKKSSKSSVLKENDLLNSTNRGEDFIPSKGLLTEANPPISTLPVPGTNATNEANVENAVTVPDEQTVVCISSLEDSENIRMQEEATKVQAAFRGYLARRAFRTLKGIVRLQAFIRGHLVRRQAVVTLFCVQRIVKLQMLARTRSGPKHSISQRRHSKKLWKNAFILKLLAPSPSSVPLLLQYSPNDPNSEWEWLGRWTKSRFWVSVSHPKKNSQSKSQVKHHNAEIDQGRPKRSVRKQPSSNSEIVSSRLSLSSEKLKRVTGKVSGNIVDKVEESSQNKTEKSNSSTRNTQSLGKSVPNQLDFDSKKLRQSLVKAPGVVASDATEQGSYDSFEAVNDMEMDSGVPKRTSKSSDMLDAVDELSEKSLPQLNVLECNVHTEKVVSKDGNVGKENKNNSQRRASFPVKIDQQENGSHSATKVPSYMAPTESAKAKLRVQESLRFSEEDMGPNSVTRRHSLPSSISGKVTSFSPRVHRLVEASGKGAVKNDKSPTSGDCGDKAIKAEWRR